uniref:Radical SAM protein n=1 Tax=Fervidicoccus fontis TaxID=683846 RepID=A0A7J3ZJY0_9CREN
MIDRLLERALEEKLKQRDRLVSTLSEREVEEARRDPHAKRRPRPCGLTIHPAVGCDRGCLYCYVPSIIGEGSIKINPLSPEQLVLSLLENPYFLPGANGTLLAVGSVTEPFLNETVTLKTLEYVRAFRRLLGNPVQIATKPYYSAELVRALVDAVEPRASILVTIVTLKHAKLLEPRAPEPEERFEFMRALVKGGLSASLFLRPIVPGTTEMEAKEVLERTLEAGVRSVVIGTLRVNWEILDRLRALSASYKHILSRVREVPTGSMQVAIEGSDLKKKVEGMARRLGFVVFPSSCSANVMSHDLSCAACSMGPCGSLENLPKIDCSCIHSSLEILGERPLQVIIEGNTIKIRLRKRARKRAAIIGTIIQTITKRQVRFFE